MYLVEKISSSVSSSISNALKLDKDNEKIIAYGAYTLIQMILCILLIVIFASIFKVVVSALIISFTGSLLRKYSGGAHATSPGRCAIIGAIVTVGLALLFKQVSIYNNIALIGILGLFSFAYSYYIILKLSPVDSPSKPITKLETKLRLRKGSITLLNCLLIICFILTFFYFKNESIKTFNSVICIYGGMLWQSFSLTKVGHNFMTYIDNLLKKTIIFRGDEII